MKLCKDCQHFRAAVLLHQCSRLGTKIEPLFGGLVPVKILFAEEERANAGKCGPEAKYFLKNEQSI